uniref:Prolactin receptor n=1 Tax=Romanomermis culicivorax TaxID=13658 RepID=A0A915IXT6_ROMCU
MSDEAAYIEQQILRNELKSNNLPFIPPKPEPIFSLPNNTDQQGLLHQLKQQDYLEANPEDPNYVPPPKKHCDLQEDRKSKERKEVEPKHKHRSHHYLDKRPLSKSKGEQKKLEGASALKHDQLKKDVDEKQESQQPEMADSEKMLD